MTPRLTIPKDFPGYFRKRLRFVKAYAYGGSIYHLNTPHRAYYAFTPDTTADPNTGKIEWSGSDETRLWVSHNWQNWDWWLELKTGIIRSGIDTLIHERTDHVRTEAATLVVELKGMLDDLDGLPLIPGDERSLPVRLQLDGGAFYWHTGDASFDTDHRGYWGAVFVDTETDATELADDLLDQIAEAVTIQNTTPWQS